MRFQTVSISPDQAKRLLENNRGNRPIRMSNVRKLASAMLDGDWMLTHQAIAISPGGRLIDGQHRLHAIVLAGRAVRCVVAYDVPEETFMALDQGARRSISDVLSGDKRTLETVTRIARIHLAGYSGGNQPTPAQVQRYLPIFVEAAETVTEARKGAVPIFTASAIRAAVALRIAMGNGDYALGIYRKLAAHDYENLPPIGRSFLSQGMTGKLPFAGQHEFQALAWRVTDEKSANRSRAYVRAEGVTQLMSDIRACIGSLLEDYDAVAA